MWFAMFAVSILWIILLLYHMGLKFQLRSLRRQLEYRISEPFKKPLTLELQDHDLMAITAALNQIFKQDEAFRSLQNKNENDYKELITNISHDLRTPLTVLKGYLQLLERCETDDAGGEYLSICFRHTDELERRIGQFFEYSYWMNQEQKLQLKALNITNIIVDTMTDFIPVFEEKGITMRLDQPNVCKGLADEELLRRVMQNLLKNCLQYSVGEVVVSVTEETESSMPAPQNHAQNGRIRICVQNPIAADSKLDAAKIFQRFYVERKERNHTTGLGLSIVKLLVEKMEGEVFVMRDENVLRVGFYLGKSL